MVENGDDYISELFAVTVSDDAVPTSVLCRWKLSAPSVKGDTTSFFQGVDLLLSLPAGYNSNEDAKQEYPAIHDATGTKLETLIRQVYYCLADENRSEAAVKIILAPRGGYLCRSDVLNFRMQHSAFVEAVVELSAWDEQLHAVPTHNPHKLLPLLLSSPGAVVGKRSELSVYETLQQLQKEMEMRLSFDWVLPTKPLARRVAIVGGRAQGDKESGQYSSQCYFEAAQALGMSIIVFEDEGHWLQSDEYAHLREEFVPLDMSNLVELPQRMADVIRNRAKLTASPPSPISGTHKYRGTAGPA
ncbi:hypothetical protein O1611_g9622 [Lasiodiplodia mahajangana]|uniref:Uncharacterized protein n=1 Tax=Lasiodiplodia mahajangana TaxID=1108764 RepID=A0ACC2J7N6_9PEZI|nr:hypothetical protein O1611_g9622 [Lasiodiplodia mahajangana]